MNGMDWMNWVGWLAPLLAKGTILLGLGFGIVAVIGNRQSAASRRWTWSVVMAGLLLLAGFELVTPKWLRLEKADWDWPASEAMAEVPAGAKPLEPERLGEPQLPVPFTLPAPEAPLSTTPSDPAIFEPALSIPSSDPVAPESPDRSRFSVPRLAAVFFFTWLAGASFLGVRLLLSRLTLRRLERVSRNPDASWTLLAEHVSRESGLSETPRLMLSEQATVPMAWGIFRPRVLLPENANELDTASRQSLLQHEFNHIAHRDALGLLVARCATLLHWPNPLAWLALRRLRLAQEQACDDAAMSAGGTPADYAELLVEIARRGRSTPFSPDAIALTMAAGSSLKQRINAILDPDMKRNPPKKAEILFTFTLLSGLTLFLTGLAWSDDNQTTPGKERPEPAGISQPNPIPDGVLRPEADGLTIAAPDPFDPKKSVSTFDSPVLISEPDPPLGDTVLLKLVNVLPGSVGVETARAIASDVVKDHPEAARKLADGSATTAFMLSGNRRLTVSVSETGSKRTLFSRAYSLQNPANPETLGVAFAPEAPTPARTAPSFFGGSSRSVPINPLEQRLYATTIERVDFVETPLTDVLEFLQDLSRQKSRSGINLLLLREARRQAEGAESSNGYFKKLIEAQAKRTAEARNDFQEHSARMEALRKVLAAEIDAAFAKERNAAHAEFEALRKRWAQLKEEEDTAERYLGRVRDDLTTAENLVERIDSEIRTEQDRRLAALENGIEALELEQARSSYQSALSDFDAVKREAGSPSPRAADSLITLQIENVPLGEVLRYVTQLAGLTYEVQAHAVVIGTPEEIAAMKSRRPASVSAAVPAAPKNSLGRGTATPGGAIVPSPKSRAPTPPAADFRKIPTPAATGKARGASASGGY